jgi:hypothetical protein
VLFELCEEFNKLNLRIVANTEATEMEVGSNLHNKVELKLISFHKKV